MKKIFIVAEIGCNHNGSKELARQMVLKAKECGVTSDIRPGRDAEKWVNVIARKI